MSRVLCWLVLLSLAGCRRPEPGPADPMAGIDPSLRAATAGVAWLTEPRDHVTAHARNSALLSDAAAQAEFALSQLHAWFGEPPRPGSIHLLVVPPERFATMVAGAREKGVNAVSFGATLVVREGADRVRGLDSICHESVHAFLAARLDPRPPLWLEEGLAVHWGRRLAEDLHRLRGLEVQDRLVEPAGAFYDVTLYPDYPADPVLLASFHARCGLLVRDIESAVGAAGLPAYVRRVAAAPGQWRVLMKRSE